MEVWRTIPSFPLHQASSLGRVRRDPATQTCRGAKPEALSPAIRRKGYHGYRLARGDGTYANALGNRLVCEAFHGPAPTPKHEAAHGDGVPGHNTPDNLRWATSAENKADMKLHGTHRSGEAIPWARLKRSQIPEIRARLANKEPMLKIAADYNVSDSAINGIRIGRNWKDA